MYIRRKVFSVITDEFGEERYFSTTEFINEEAYLEEREYTYKDAKGNIRDSYTNEIKVSAKDAANLEDGVLYTKDGKLKKSAQKVESKKKAPRGVKVEAADPSANYAGGGEVYKEFKVDKKRSAAEAKKLKEQLKRLNEEGRGAAAKKEAEALIASRKAAAARLRGEGYAAAEKVAKSKLGKYAAGAAALGTAAAGGAYYAGRRANK